jgi:hypothetical protein
LASKIGLLVNSYRGPDNHDVAPVLLPRSFKMKQKHPDGPPMTLGNMRALGVDVLCLN